MKIIPYGRQSLGADDRKAVLETLRSDWLTQGPKVSEFEEIFAAYCGAKYAVAVANGTAALHLACLAAGLKKGDEAITSPISFMATSNAVLYAGALPVFADIDYETVNISSAEIRKKITSRTKAVLPVHMAGLPADLKEISALAKKRGLVVIEDGCHALGAEYRENKIGSCRYSDMTVFSFHPVKHITTGEGGMITTNSKAYYEKLLRLRTHGIVKTPRLNKRYGGWYMEMRDLGFNYRITDLQCALGISQLKKLSGFIRKRRAIAARYDAGFKDFSDKVKLPSLNYPDRTHAWHLYLLRLLKYDRRKFYDALVREGIKAQVHYIPITNQPYYKVLLKGKRINVPQSRRYYEQTISLPMYPSLKNKEIDRIIDFTKSVILRESKYE